MTIFAGETGWQLISVQVYDPESFFNSVTDVWIAARSLPQLRRQTSQKKTETKEKTALHAYEVGHINTHLNI